MSEDRGSERPTNRLDDETSPYLRQHRFNPVDWYPWGEEALQVARREDKPIFLSIGYSACHWCHVMERESFEDEETAELLNEHFVPVKVDREERPDLDDIYMSAVMMMTGRGGWPLNVFLTPDLEPFFGGTYYPPESRMGMPGFRTLLRSVAETWENDRSQVDRVADQLRERLQSRDRSPGGREMLDRDLVADAVRQARSRYDAAHGGFSTAPKFPQAGLIRLLLHVGHRRGEDDTLEMATHTLERMAAGGIRDHLAGGFARYSVDERWLVPHFEKMLYDNAQLAVAYVDAHQATGEPTFARVAEETLDWMIREMQDEEGGFHSSVDADSEGEEGKYYVWSRREVEELLGDDAEPFCRVYDVTEAGNWEGANILNRSHASLDEIAADLGTDPGALRRTLDRCRETLLEARSERVPPGTDDKVLVDWNGLAIAALARGYRVLGEERFLESARRAAGFVFEEMVRDGRLLHTWRQGEARLLAYLDDHANMIAAALELYESTFDPVWLRRARELAEATIELFADEEAGGFFLTGGDHEELLTRPKSGHDGSTPSGNGMAAVALLRLATLTGEDEPATRGRETIRAFQPQLERQAMAHPHLLMALDYYYRSPTEIVVVGGADDPEVRRSLRELWGRLAPHAVVVLHDPDADADRATPDELPLLEGKEPVGETPTFYVCEDYVCEAPTGELEEALRALEA